MRELWRFRRVAANGRLEVSCRECGLFFWLSEKEFSWQACPACLGWWCLPGHSANVPD